MTAMFRYRYPVCIVLVSLLLGTFPVLAETDPKTGNDLQALYKALELFDFRNDAVMQLDGRLLVEATAKRHDETYFNHLLKNPTTFAALCVVAFVRNPDLESLRQAVRARAEMYPQTMFVDALAEQYRSFLQGIETRTAGVSMKSSPDLLFPGPGILTFNGRLARLEVDMALEEYAMKLRDVAADLWAMAAEREMYRQSIAVMDQSVSILGAFEESLISRLSTDKVMYPELARLQSERRRMQNERASMDRMVDASLAALNRLLGRKSEAPIGRVALPHTAWSPEKRSVLAFALEHRQEIRLQKISLRLLETLLALKTRSTLAPLSPSFAYAKSGMPAPSRSVSKRGMAGARERMDPLAGYKTTFDTGISTTKAPEYGGPVSYLRELQRRIESEKARLSDLENSTGSELVAAWADLDNARHSAINERSGVLVGLEKALQSAETGYRTGQVTFLEYLDLFLNTLSSRLAAIRYDYEAAKAIAKIMMLRGTAND